MAAEESVTEPYLDDGDVRIYVGDSRDVLAQLPDQSVHAIATSPPFFGLRDYGTGEWVGGDPDCAHERPSTTMNVGFNERWGQGGGEKCQERKSGGQYAGTCPKCGADRIDHQIGLEATPDAWAASIVDVMRHARRVLRDDGSLWIECGDSYAGGGRGGHEGGSLEGSPPQGNGGYPRPPVFGDLKPTDLIGAPYLLAFALRADGWFWRGAYVWEKPDCLSGGTRIYASTQKGEMPTTVKDLARLDPATVNLWNGQRWTQLVAMWETSREGALEIELRNGERIGCTPGHQWPTNRGLLRADQLRVGDVVEACRLPESATLRAPAYLPDAEVGWLVGLYLAEGSRSGGCMSFAGHVRETARYDRLRRIAIALDGSAKMHREKGNAATIHLYGPAISGVLDAYVSGNTAHRKHLSSRCWKRSNAFLRAVLEGYLEGDGHYDASNERWRLGFCRNDALAGDLRTVAARIGASLRLKRNRTGWGGNLRYAPREHPNARHDGEVIAIRRSRARKFWDISVADDPHTFALASGVVTHNCMPESIDNRCTTSHSTVLHFAKTNEPTFWTHRDGRGTRRRPTADYVYVRRESGEEVPADQFAAGSTPDPKRWKRVNLWKGRNYFFDRDAIREPFSDYSTGGDGGSYGAGADSVRVWNGGSRGSTRHVRHRDEEQDDGHVQPTLDGGVPEPELRGPDGRKAFHIEAGPNSEQHRDGSRWPSLEGRSPRSVWRITTEANSFGLCPACRTFWPERAPARHCGVDVVAHFAVWPHALVGKIIDAATSEAGCCADCGAPRARMTRSAQERDHETTAANGLGRRDVDGYGIRDGVRVLTSHLGWQPTCECAAATVPCIVLDPFGGSGTTGRQARASGRHCVLVELSPDYAEIASRRLAQQGLPLVAG